MYREIIDFCCTLKISNDRVNPASDVVPYFNVACAIRK